jgi:hypothetical protein
MSSLDILLPFIYNASSIRKIKKYSVYWGTKVNQYDGILAGKAQKQIYVSFIYIWLPGEQDGEP